LQQQVEKRPGDQVEDQKQDGQEKEKIRSLFQKMPPFLRQGGFPLPPGRESHRDNQNAEEESEEARESVQHSISVENHAPF